VVGQIAPQSQFRPRRVSSGRGRFEGSRSTRKASRRPGGTM